MHIQDSQLGHFNENLKDIWNAEEIIILFLLKSQ